MQITIQQETVARTGCRACKKKQDYNSNLKVLSRRSLSISHNSQIILWLQVNKDIWKRKGYRDSQMHRQGESVPSRID